MSALRRGALGLLGAVATALVLSLVVFAALSSAPGESTAGGAEGSGSAAARAALRAEYHLDDPLPTRYADWIGGIAHGDLGRSIALREPVADVLVDRLPATLELVGLAALVALGLGIGLGRLAALRGGRVDRAVMAGTSLLTAVPAYVAAIALLAVLAVGLGWFPVFGEGDGVGGRLWHLVLPALALGLGPVGVLARATRAAMVDAARAEHLAAARVAGVPERLAVRRHVVRNAAPQVLAIGGLEVGLLFAGSAVVEVAFGVDGIGSLLVTSVQGKDFAVVQAVALILIVAFTLTTAIADGASRRLDPRPRALAEAA